MPLMNFKYWIIAGMLLPVVLLALALLRPDGPDYEVVERGDGFELRSYPPLRVAETRVSVEFDGVDDAAYPLLVAYVRGYNSGGRQVPMLAPVLLQATEDDGWLMQFVMPKEYLMSMLPQPANEAVTLRQIPQRFVAAHRFAGGWEVERWDEQAGRLVYAVEQAGLSAVGEPMFARYNAGFVPGFLRRNEVLLPVERPAQLSRER